MLRILLPLLLALALLVGCTSGEQGTNEGEAPEATEATEALFADGTATRGAVLALSLDGLSSTGLRQMGAMRAPNLFRLMAVGASTLDARTALETTTALANQTGMLTGRRVDPAQGGHGITADHDDPGPTVDADSVFTVVHAAGRHTAMVTDAPSSELFRRSWAADLDTYEQVCGGPEQVVARALELGAAMSGRKNEGVVVAQIRTVDRAGHRHGFNSFDYRQTITDVDRALAPIEDALLDGTLRAVVITSDHGGALGADRHADPHEPEDFTVPFVLVAPRVPPGVDLGRLTGVVPLEGEQAAYDGPQPARNADLGNAVTALLGLEPIPGSEFRAVHDALTR